MSSPIKNVALVGGSGRLGSFILKSLTEHDFNTTVITRISSNVTFLPHIKVFRVSDSYSLDELLLAFRDQDAVVVSISPNGADAQHCMVDAAVLAGVRRFIPSHWGWNAENKAAVESQSGLIAKAEIVDYLRTKESTGLTWTSIVPGFFIDVSLKSGLLGFNLSTREATIWGTGDRRFSAGTLATTGEAVSKVLLHEQETANKYVHISAIETTQNEILASLESKTGGQPWRVSRRSVDELLRESMEGIARGDTWSRGYLALASCFISEHGSNFAREGKLLNDKLELSGQILDNIVADALL